MFLCEINVFLKKKFKVQSCKLKSPFLIPCLQLKKLHRAMEGTLISCIHDDLIIEHVLPKKIILCHQFFWTQSFPCLEN